MQYINDNVVVEDQKIPVTKCHSLALAVQAKVHDAKLWLIIGDENDPYGQYWLVHLDYAEKLFVAGYMIV